MRACHQACERLIAYVGDPGCVDRIGNQKIEQEAALIRKASVQRYIPCITSLDTARALLFALRSKQKGEIPECLPVDAYLAGGAAESV